MNTLTKKQLNEICKATVKMLKRISAEELKQSLRNWYKLSDKYRRKQ